MSQPEPCLSVVMPCYNEAATVKRVVERVLESPWCAELIVVDDASTDGTAGQLDGIDDPRVTVLHQPRNLGKGAALRRGFAAATAPFVVVQDADEEYDPSEYGSLLGPLLAGEADVVYGSRFLGGRPHRVLYFWHAVGNKLLTTLSNMLTNLTLTDMETCYKAFRREVIQGIAIEEDRFGVEPEITAKVARGRWRIYEIGISYNGRTYDEGKKIGWRDGVRALVCIVRYSSSRRPVLAQQPDHDDPLDKVLEDLANAPRYAEWVAGLLTPHLGDSVLEVGAGKGAVTRHLTMQTRVLATDISPQFVEELAVEVSDDPRIDVAVATLEDLERTRPGEFDSVVAVNVLEHIEDDRAALVAMKTLVRPGGSIVLFVPANGALYGRFDAMIGHFRRYRSKELRIKLEDAGLAVEQVRHVNAIGAVAWFLVVRLGGKVPTGGVLQRSFDRLVPLIRRVDPHLARGFGQSLVAVARRPR